MHKYNNIVTKLADLVPGVCFYPGNKYYWSPDEQRIYYSPQNLKDEDSQWALLHETGHAMLKHDHYRTDYELLRLEIAAWEKAKQIAIKLGVAIKEQHIQDCIDSYRDWLYKRSICPNCHNKALQQDESSTYRCFNCHTKWQVSQSRFCRAYRVRAAETEPTPI